jgi:hypothetical protein
MIYLISEQANIKNEIAICAKLSTVVVFASEFNF